MARKRIAHETFQIERTFKASPESVFAAWENLEAKASWFIGPDDWHVVKREIDFRVGGHELLIGRFADGRESNFLARFHEIIPTRRIVFVYDMAMMDAPHSVSLASVEIEPLDSDHTRLTFTEQVAFLDGTPGQKGVASRKDGTTAHLERLNAFLEGVRK